MPSFRLESLLLAESKRQIFKQSQSLLLKGQFMLAY